MGLRTASVLSDGWINTGTPSTIPGSPKPRQDKMRRLFSHELRNCFVEIYSFPQEMGLCCMFWWDQSTSRRFSSQEWLIHFRGKKLNNGFSFFNLLTQLILKGCSKVLWCSIIYPKKELMVWRLDPSRVFLKGWTNIWALDFVSLKERLC